MKTRMKLPSPAHATVPAERQNDALTDAQLEPVAAAGGAAGINPSRTDRGTSVRSA